MPDYAHVAKALGDRRPGFTLPQPFYTDLDIHRFDLEAIFSTSWLFVAFEVELPTAGSFLSMRVGLTPIVLVRGRDGVVRGFFNSCRHRGAQICAEGRGHSQRLVCPYHQWAYDLDGSKLTARGLGPELDKRDFGLVEIRVETVGGTIYVCLADSPPDFEPFRAAFGPLISHYHLDKTRVAYEQVIVERANWKLAIENARECAHCRVGHPELCRTNVDVFTLDYHDEANQQMHAFTERLTRKGRGVGPFEGDWFSTGHVPLQPGMRSMTMDGNYVVKKLLTEDTDLGVLRWSLQPHCYNLALPDYVFTFSAMPISADETVIHSKWLVREDAIEGVDYELEEFVRLWTLTNNQDVRLTELNQRGVASAGYRPGPYMKGAEDWCLRFVDWYCQKATHYLQKNGYLDPTGTVARSA
ncbi:MAG: aromatic ring-hydroxylating dioxygenase subunit alpha [Dongiaceae bacterium]